VVEVELLQHADVVALARYRPGRRSSRDPATDDRDAHPRILPVVPDLPPHLEVRPILTRLASIVEELGDDVRAEPGETRIAFFRDRPFALLDAATSRRLDVLLILPAAEETERLRPGPDGYTHQVSLAHEDEIDAELVTWLRDAYDAAATP
jgi:hypothetical protein